MASAPQSDVLLIQQVRTGDEDAWRELIARFEGRLLSFVQSRLHDRATSEDVVQETFIGLLTSLPNYDPARPLEGYLFSIAAHKLTDQLRRSGRRPALPLSAAAGSDGVWDIAGSARPASSIARSDERRGLEAAALTAALKHQLDQWRQQKAWVKIECLELLFVCGWANKDVATHLKLSEQQVANYKFDFLAKLRNLIQKQGLPADVFPELYPDPSESP